MTVRRNYRCHRCGHRFSKEVYDENETRDLRRRGVVVDQIRCPNPNCRAPIDHTNRI